MGFLEVSHVARRHDATLYCVLESDHSTIRRNMLPKQHNQGERLCFINR